jgi:hypothetical protein
MYLANRSIVCRPKSKGGLRIINIEMMNIALIGKWYWKWFSTQPSLWRQLNCSLGASLMEWEMSNPMSFWKQVKMVAMPFEICITFSLGNEANSSLWRHNWGHEILKSVFHNLYTYCNLHNILVKDLPSIEDMDSLFLLNLSSSAQQQFTTFKMLILPTISNRPQTQSVALLWNLTSDRQFSCK